MKIKPANRIRMIFAALILFVGAFLLYARSLHYPFVYDDLWRVAKNDSIKSLSGAGRFFTDRRTQSNLEGLHRDSYRPLVTLSFAVDYALYKLNPAGYRVENIMLHGLNGVLVAALGVQLLSLSIPAAVAAGALFLIHPVQTESVVWIVERTNVLGIFFLLAGLIFWVLFQLREKKRYALGTHTFLILSLLTREIAVVLPAMLVLIDHMKGYKKRWGHYLAAVLIVAAYMVLRSSILGQIRIAPFKGEGLLANLANVAQIWPLYWRVVFSPERLRVTYSDIEPVYQLFNPAVGVGVAGLLVFAAAFIWTFRKKSRWALALGGIFLFWLPGSNLIPLTTLFAERLLYPLMIGFGWMGGLLFDRLRPGGLRRVFILSLFTLLTGLTWLHLPVWRSELALWENAVKQAPRAWFAWACYGQALQEKAQSEEKTNPEASLEDWRRSAWALDEALANGPPAGGASQVLLLSAKARYRLGMREEAALLAAKARQIEKRGRP